MGQTRRDKALKKLAESNYRRVNMPDCCYTCHFLGQGYDGVTFCGFYRGTVDVDVQPDYVCNDFKRDTENFPLPETGQ